MTISTARRTPMQNPAVLAIKIFIGRAYSLSTFIRFRRLRLEKNGLEERVSEELASNILVSDPLEETGDR